MGRSASRRGFAFVVYLGAFALLLRQPLLDWLRLARTSELHSYVLLIPLVSGYLIWLRRRAGLPLAARSAGWAVAFGLAAGLLFWGSWSAGRTAATGADVQLSGWILGFLLVGIAGAFWFWGTGILRALAFPVAFLVFMVPLPNVVVGGIETFLQHASADWVQVMFAGSGTPYVRQGLYFWLPGLHIEVARECSGIRSSLVLFITAWLAGYMMLRTPWKRAVLALAVVPLGIARNAFRIFTLSMLSVHVDPTIINSPLHHRGGPLFFLVALVPLFLLLWGLRRSERRRDATLPPQSKPSHP